MGNITKEHVPDKQKQKYVKHNVTEYNFFLDGKFGQH
jgi:hypothetical protein